MREIQISDEDDAYEATLQTSDDGSPPTLHVRDRDGDREVEPTEFIDDGPRADDVVFSYFYRRRDTCSQEDLAIGDAYLKRNPNGQQFGVRIEFDEPTESPGIYKFRAQPLVRLVPGESYVTSVEIVLMDEERAYPIPFTRISDASRCLGWIKHLTGKKWVTRQMIDFFVDACDQRFNYVNRDA